MLETWLYRGILDDPFDEFMIVIEPHMRVAGAQATVDEDFDDDEDSIDDDGEARAMCTPGARRSTSVAGGGELGSEAYFSEDFWTKTYFVRKDYVPEFLVGTAAQQIVDTGKYLNVIKKCGQASRCPFEAAIEFSEGDTPLLCTIAKAHAFASQSLLKFLVDQHDLFGVLRVVKHYFLMDQGDFMEEFMALCDAELGGCVGECNINRLNTLLELALRLSIGADEHHKDDITGSCVHLSVLLNCLECGWFFIVIFL